MLNFSYQGEPRWTTSGWPASKLKDPFGTPSHPTQLHATPPHQTRPGGLVV